MPHYDDHNYNNHSDQPCPGPLVEYPTSRACRVVALSTGEVVQQVSMVGVHGDHGDHGRTLHWRSCSTGEDIITMINMMGKCNDDYDDDGNKCFQTVTPTELCSPKDVFRLKLNIARQYRDGAGGCDCHGSL